MTNIKELLLVLQHDELPHIERWWSTDDPHTIWVDFDCPQNYPPRGNHTLSVIEAMRQYALMTSCENWFVDDDTGWHDFIDAYGYYDLLALYPEEFHTVIAALRFYQQGGQGEPRCRSNYIHELATNGLEVTSLDDEGIDELIERINNVDY